MIALHTICRDETPYLKEFIEHHLSIGFDKIFVYDNDSIISVSSTLDAFIKLGKAEVVVVSGECQQLKSQNHMLQNHPEFDWIAFFDCDEFLVLKKHNNIKDFLDEYKDFGGLGIHWKVFGTSGLQDRDINIPITKSFTKCFPDWHIKSIVQPKYTTSNVGNPHSFYYKNGFYLVDENKNRIEQKPENHQGAQHLPISTNIVQLNHYVLKSFNEYKTKFLRYKNHSADGSTHKSTIEQDIYNIDSKCVEDDFTLCSNLETNLPKDKMTTKDFFKKVKVRFDIVELLNNIKAKTIAEVGVRDGGHLQDLLKAKYVKEIYAIDIWDLWEGKDLNQNDDKSTKELLAQRYENILAMAKDDKRIKVVKDFSVAAISNFKDSFFDFIYIDADHSEGAVYNDMKASWSKIKSGGILSGHDFHEICWKGVCASVKRFAKENNVEFYVDDEIDWFIVKP